MDVTNVIACPEYAVLRRFLESVMPDDEAGALESHIGDCTACLEALNVLLESEDNSEATCGASCVAEV